MSSALPKYYVLEMFPYPSGRIHMGHVRNYTMGDVIARFRRAQGYNVLHPMGWDAFGLPAENAAREKNVHPRDWTYANIDAMREQLKRMGLAIDWSREFATCDPDYYALQQQLFLDLLREGLVYRAEADVNWDPVDQTVLANEQVIEGRGWRSGAIVERRKLAQWFFKITAFADELLNGLEDLQKWPEKVRLMQKNWIGRSEGLRFSFELKHAPVSRIEVFSTRPDTLFGASFIALSPDHPLAERMATDNEALAAFIRECHRGGTAEEAIETAEKHGFDTGIKALHPFDPAWELPVYVANFVLMAYGTGAIFGCPAHDQRDLEFARKYGLPVVPVVVPEDADPEQFVIGDEAYIGPGRLAHSRFLDGMDVVSAKTEVARRLESAGTGERTVHYRLRDWLISRQRYWGCPIPIIHCATCGTVPVPQTDLPVRLPDDATFDQPGNPLANHPSWKHVTCPQCGGAATRETDTLDTFVDSSWYFARFTSPHAETACRSPCRALLDAGRSVYRRASSTRSCICFMPDSSPGRSPGRANCPYRNHLPDRSPRAWSAMKPIAMKTAIGCCPRRLKNSGGDAFRRGTNVPVSVGPSEKMSKSKKNVVAPESIIDIFGADAIRWFMLSDTPPERDIEWTQEGAEGCWRFIQRIYRLVGEAKSASSGGADENPDVTVELRRATHRAIAAVTDDLNALRFNRAVAQVYTLANAIQASSGRPAARHEAVETLVLLIGPDDAAPRRDLLERTGQEHDAGVGALAQRGSASRGERYGRDRGSGQRQTARRDRNRQRSRGGGGETKRAGTRSGTARIAGQTAPSRHRRTRAYRQRCRIIRRAPPCIFARTATYAAADFIRC